MTKKNIKILQIAILIPFAIFWFNSGDYHFFFDFLQKPTPDRELFYYLIIFVLGSGISGWIIKKKRNKIKRRIRETQQKPGQHVESTIKTSKTLNIPQESIDQLEKTRQTYIWLFSITFLVIFFAVMGFLTTGDPKSGVMFKLIWLIIVITGIGALLQWRYAKQYKNIYVDKVLDNLRDVDVGIVDHCPKNTIKQYLPGMPYGQIKGSETLVLVTDKYSAEVTSITIQRNDNNGGGAG